MAIIGVIYNPNSGKKRRGAIHSHIDSVRNAKNIVFQQTNSVDDIPQALEDIAAKNADYLAIIGGDGTLDTVMTELRAKKLFKKEPTIALYDAGTTNMAHKDVGFSGDSNQPILDLLQWADEGIVKTVSRAPIAVKSDTRKTPLYGFFLGTSAIPRVIHKTRKNLHDRGFNSTFSESVTMAIMLWRLAQGKPTEDLLLKPTPTTIKHNSTTQKVDTVFLTITSLDKLLLGIKPQQQGKGGMSVMGVFNPYKRFIHHLPTLLFGKHPLDPKKDDGCIGFRTDSCDLSFDGEWTLDGEMYQASEDAPISVSIEKPFTFALGKA